MPNTGMRPEIHVASLDNTEVVGVDKTHNSNGHLFENDEQQSKRQDRGRSPTSHAVCTSSQQVAQASW
jgi:hypothetical protein